MALNILRQPSLGGQIGEAFGTGLGSSLQNLANMKLNQLQQGQQAARLQQAGLPEVLAYLDPQVQASYLREYGAQQQISQQEVAQNIAEQYLQQAEQGSFLRDQAPPLQQLDRAQQLTPEQQQQGLQALQQLGQSIPGEGFRGQDIQSQLMDQTLQAPGISQLLDSVAPQPLAQPQQIGQQPQQIAQAPILPQRQVSNTSEARLKRTVDALDKKLLDPSVDTRAKSVLRKRKDEQEIKLTKMRDRLFDKTEPVRKEITENARNATEMINILELQKDMNEKGALDTPGMLAFLDEIGLGDIDALKTGDTQTFLKSTGSFLKDLKKVFGGRITDNEIKIYLKTIPNLYQSPEGRRRIIESLLTGHRGSLVRAQEMDKILERNEGIPTNTLARDVDQGSKRQLDKLHKQYLKEIKKKELKPLESRPAAIGKAIAGKALSSVPSALKGALKGGLAGAAFGKKFGGVGTLGGAGLGALAGLSGLI